MKGQKLFHGYEVIDADVPLLVHVQKRDIDKGKPLQGDECAIALACKRMFASPKVLIARTTAYVVHEDGDGYLKAFRYQVGSKAFKIISSNDKGLETHSRTITLNPVRPSQRLDLKRERIKEWRAAPKKKPRADGRGKNGGAAARKAIEAQVRNYTGRVNLTTSP